MSIQSKIFSSHDYKSAKDLEDMLNRFNAAHRVISINQIPRDYQTQGPVPQVVRGYDIIVQYDQHERISSRSVKSENTTEDLQYGPRGTIKLGKKKTRLSMVEKEYMDRFLKVGLDSFATREELAEIHNSSDDGSMARRTTIARLRCKIKKLGYEIVSGGNLGYILKKA